MALKEIEELERRKEVLAEQISQVQSIVTEEGVETEEELRAEIEELKRQKEGIEERKGAM